MFNFQGFINFELFKKWCHQESNRGHKDFQSFALPTELWYHLAFCGCKGTINILIEQEKTKYFLLLNVY